MSDTGVAKINGLVSSALAVDGGSVMPHQKTLVVFKGDLPPGKVLRLTQFFTYTLSQSGIVWDYTFNWQDTALFTYSANTIVASTPKAGKLRALIYNMATDPLATPQIQVAVEVDFQGGLVDVSNTSPTSVPNADDGTHTADMSLTIATHSGQTSDGVLTWRDTMWEILDQVSWTATGPGIGG